MILKPSRKLGGFFVEIFRKGFVLKSDAKLLNSFVFNAWPLGDVAD
jgi:hypothetical protein